MRPGDRAGPPAVVTAVAGAATVAAMVATPLLPPRGRGRRRLTSVVVTGLAATTAVNVVRRWGVARGAAAAGVITAATAAIEHVGTRTGWPFGRYAYTSALRPRVVGVPVVVPLAWFAMAAPARDVAHRALGGRSWAAARIAVGSAALTAWDLFLDPQMVGEGYWTWARPGRYRGIPLSNYAGWFVTGLGIMTILELLLPPGRRAPASTRPLTYEYAYMAVMETVGFARFFADPLVALVGGAAMLPVSAVALARSDDG